MSNDDHAKTRLTELLNDLVGKAVEIEKTDLPNARELGESLGLTIHLITEALGTLGITIDLDEPENDWQPEN